MLLQFSTAANCAPATCESFDTSILARQRDCCREHVDHCELRDTPQQVMATDGDRARCRDEREVRDARNRRAGITGDAHAGRASIASSLERLDRIARPS